jgi:hypothetical protein
MVLLKNHPQGTNPKAEDASRKQQIFGRVAPEEKQRAEHKK